MSEEEYFEEDDKSINKSAVMSIKVSTTDEYFEEEGELFESEDIIKSERKPVDKKMALLKGEYFESKDNLA